MEERLELLERVPLLSDVPRDVLAKIAEIAEEKEMPAESALTHEGRHEGYFFIVIGGSVRIERGGRVINRLGPGDFLGSTALLDGGPRTATATTDTPCRILSIRNEEFYELLEVSPTVRGTVLEAADRNLRAMDEEAAI
jgi:CRP/FNR family cyclic AMP-dependent transcriptional regulator